MEQHIPNNGVRKMHLYHIGGLEVVARMPFILNVPYKHMFLLFHSSKTVYIEKLLRLLHHCIMSEDKIDFSMRFLLFRYRNMCYE